jgi:hypothetical protein
MATVINHEFRDMSNQATFPFTTESTMVQDSVEIPNNCFLDALLYPIQGREAPFYIQRLNNLYVDKNALEIVIYDNNSFEVCRAACSVSDSKAMTYDSSNRVVGVLVYNPTELATLMGQVGNADIEIEPDVAQFTAGVSFSTDPDGPLYINTADNSYTEDIVWCAAGGVHFESRSATPPEPIESSSEHSVVSSSSQSNSTSSSTSSQSSSSQSSSSQSSSSPSSESSQSSSSLSSVSSSDSSLTSESTINRSTSSVFTSNALTSSSSSSTEGMSTTSSVSESSSSSDSSSSHSSSSDSTDGPTWLYQSNVLKPFDTGLEGYYGFHRNDAYYSVGKKWPDYSSHHRDLAETSSASNPRAFGDAYGLDYMLEAFGLAAPWRRSSDTPIGMPGPFTIKFFGTFKWASGGEAYLFYNYTAADDNFILSVDWAATDTSSSVPTPLKVTINGQSVEWIIDRINAPSHWVLRRDASNNIFLYRNGALVDGSTPRQLGGTVGSSSNTLYIGDNDTAAFGLKVYLDELGFWSVDVGEAGADALYNNGVPNQYTAEWDPSSSSTEALTTSSSEAPYSTVSSSSSSSTQAKSSTSSESSDSSSSDSSTSVSSSSSSSLSSDSSSSLSSDSSSSDSSSQSKSFSSSSSSSTQSNVSSSSSSTDTDSVSSSSGSTQEQTTSSSSLSSTSSSTGSSSSSGILTGDAIVSINLYGEVSEGTQPITSMNNQKMEHAWLAATPDSAIRVRTLDGTIFIGKSKDFGNAS